MEHSPRVRPPKKKSTPARSRKPRARAGSAVDRTSPEAVAASAPGTIGSELTGAPATQYTRREGHVLVVDDVSSARMGLVRQQGTKPELVVRSLLTALGHRFRVGRRGLQGSPDIVNSRRRWVVFVHGCFWHRHGCKATTTPGRNREFWEAKFQRNVERDRRSIEALEALGYNVVVVWECETKRELDRLRERLAAALGPGVTRAAAKAGSP